MVIRNVIEGSVKVGRFLAVRPSLASFLHESPSVQFFGDRITDLTTGPDGTLYAARGVAGGPFSLETVNSASGALTNIGPLVDRTLLGGFYSLAFSSDGKLYGHQTNSPGSFDQINPATGASVVNIPGGVAGGALGLGFDPGSGLLIASECCDGVGLGERVFSVNPITGASVQLLDFADGRRIHDLTFVPEPSLGWMIAGLLLYLVRARVR